jgi:tRNA G46 methylase TrmB
MVSKAHEEPLGCCVEPGTSSKMVSKAHEEHLECCVGPGTLSKMVSKAHEEPMDAVLGHELHQNWLVRHMKDHWMLCWARNCIKVG